jgi:hypothetical protein
MPDEGLDYTSPETPEAVRPRTLGQWLILLASWAVGLVVWTIYVLVIGFIVLRFL